MDAHLSKTFKCTGTDGYNPKILCWEADMSVTEKRITEG